MQAIDFLFVGAILIMSVVIHEISHGYAALLFGDRTAEYEGRLTLNPLKHLDPVGSVLVPIISYMTAGMLFGWAKPGPYNPYNFTIANRRLGEAIVAGAGPLANIVIALVFSLLIRVFGETLSYSFISIAGLLVYTNILLALFNLTPIPPLDGSKILFSFLPPLGGSRVFLEKNGFILALVFLFFLWPLLTPFISSLFSLITGIPL
ncbi:MAG: site-2 protease family protein [Patescibacteria group bacterium]